MISASVNDCRVYLRKARQNQEAVPEAIEAKVFSLLGEVLPRTTRLGRRGSGPLTARLPESIQDGASACRYYEELLKVSSFRTLVRNFVFRTVATKFPYEYPAYMVDEVGFKLSKRKERVRPNQLCQFIGAESGKERPNLHLATEPVHLMINAAAPQRIADFIARDVKWS